MLSITILKIALQLSFILIGCAAGFLEMDSNLFDVTALAKRNSNATSVISCIETAALTQTCPTGSIGLTIYTRLNQKTLTILEQLTKLNITAAFFVTPGVTTDYGMLGKIARFGHVIGILTDNSDTIDSYKNIFLDKLGVSPKHVIFDSSWNGLLKPIPQSILNMNLYPFKWSFDPHDSVTGSTADSVQSYYQQAMNPSSKFISIHSEASSLFTPALLSFIKKSADDNNISIVSVDQCTKVKRFWDDCTFNASLSDVKFITNSVLFATSVPKTNGDSSLRFELLFSVSIILLL